MILLFPTLIDFKDPAERKNFEVSCHMFYPRRVLDIPDGKPKWTGINDQSDLCGDSPAEAIEKRKRAVEDEEKKKRVKQDEGGS